MKKLTALIFSIILVMCLGGCNNEAPSIGIIGGADGPTARVVTSTIIWQSIFGLVAVIIATTVIAVIAVIIYLNKKKK
jgi:Na+-transporting methylmalonyl-CoA/oxaloacetate decarboxylase beta subunit